MLDSAAAGLLTGLTLIIAIGAQNAFVLRQGIRREHVLAVVALCTVSDVVLIIAGIAGVGALISAHPSALDVAKFGGASFLIKQNVFRNYDFKRATALVEQALSLPAVEQP